MEVQKDKAKFTLKEVVNLLEEHGFHVQEAKEEEKAMACADKCNGKKIGAILVKITPAFEGGV